MRACAGYGARLEVIVHRQWLVTLQGLPDAGRMWDADISRKLLEDVDQGKVDALSDLCGDMHWQVSLTHQGQLFHLQGRWSGAIRRRCSRCNAEFDWPVSGQTERDFQMGTARPEEGDESECEFLSPPGLIDLLDVLREDVWLAWKADVICRDSCRGLCPHCGADLNRESCQCGKGGEDHPFAALRRLKTGMEG